MGWWFLKTMARKHRDLQNLTQREVGDKVFRSIDTVRAWEQGRTDIPLSQIEKLAEALGMSKEVGKYMEWVAVCKRKGVPLEADQRLNALFVALGEEYCGYIFKWDANIIPGPLQLKLYHYLVLRMAENATDTMLGRGWAFKEERRIILESRLDNPLVQFLIGEGALLMLRALSEDLYQEQLAHLKYCAERFGWEIRILREPVRSSQGHFEIYKRGESKLWCPTYVYTELHDSSLCIEGSERVEGYDGFRDVKWNIGTRIEDY